MTQRSTDRTLSVHVFLQRSMRCEADPIEPGHVSIERAIFTFPFAQPEGLLLLAWALGGFPWPRPSGPDGPEAGPAFFTRAGPARTGGIFPA